MAYLLTYLLKTIFIFLHFYVSASKFWFRNTSYEIWSYLRALKNYEFFTMTWLGANPAWPWDSWGTSSSRDSGRWITMILIFLLMTLMMVMLLVTTLMLLIRMVMMLKRRRKSVAITFGSQQVVLTCKPWSYFLSPCTSTIIGIIIINVNIITTITIIQGGRSCATARPPVSASGEPQHTRFCREISFDANYALLDALFSSIFSY